MEHLNQNGDAFDAILKKLRVDSDANQANKENKSSESIVGKLIHYKENLILMAQNGIEMKDIVEFVTDSKFIDCDRTNALLFASNLVNTYSKKQKTKSGMFSEIATIPSNTNIVHCNNFFCQ